MRWAFLPVLLMIVAAGAPAARASAVDDAAQSLRSDPVYVAPDAERRLAPAEERRVEGEIAERGRGRISIAVLPGSAGDATSAARAVAERLGRPGVYAAIAGNEFAAGEVGRAGLDPGVAPDL